MSTRKIGGLRRTLGKLNWEVGTVDWPLRKINRTTVILRQQCWLSTTLLTIETLVPTQLWASGIVPRRSTLLCYSLRGWQSCSLSCPSVERQSNVSRACGQQGLSNSDAYTHIKNANKMTWRTNVIRRWRQTTIRRCDVRPSLLTYLSNPCSNGRLWRRCASINAVQRLFRFAFYRATALRSYKCRLERDW